MNREDCIDKAWQRVVEASMQLEQHVNHFTCKHVNKESYPWYCEDCGTYLWTVEEEELNG